MNETLKMVKFDYSVVKDVGAKYVWIFAVICTVLSLAGMFPAALGFLLFPLGLFSPIQTVRKGDFMKIYGLLPIRREYITRALFSEIVFPQLIGGGICELLLLISRAIGKSHILPSYIQEHIYDNFINATEEYMSCSDLCVVASIALACITIVVLFFYMILEVKGETFATVCCIPFVLLVGFAVVLYIRLFDNASVKIPVLSEMLPKSTAVRVTVIIASFAAIVAAGFLLCELTVKKTAKKEI